MEDGINTKEAIPVMEAAEELGTTHLRILMLIKGGLWKEVRKGATGS